MGSSGEKWEVQVNKLNQQKIIDLETQLGLLQRDFEIQNQMLLLDAKRIDRLEQTLAQLTNQFLQIRDNQTPLPSSEDDRPPHY